MTIDIDKSYTTDGKVVHLSKDEEINVKLGRIIGKKFVDYRKKWDAANRFELVTDFPLFLHLELNQTCNFKCPHCIIGNKEIVKKLKLPYIPFKVVLAEGIYGYGGEMTGTTPTIWKMEPVYSTFSEYNNILTAGHLHTKGNISDETT